MMTNKKTVQHTPGPWTMQPQYTNRAVFPIGHKLPGTRATGILAEVNSQGGMEHEASANARLIAAAPDLLEACKQAVITFDPMDDEHAATWRLLTDAIAKAQGNA